MKTYPIRNSAGVAFAFEIDNAYISIRKIRSLIPTADNATNVVTRKPFSNSGDFRMGFKYSGIDYVVTEPFGDNSRYWIGPIDDLSDTAPTYIKGIMQIFNNYDPPIYVKILGRLIKFASFQ